MAYIKMNLFSRCLMRSTPVTVILPIDHFPYPGIPEREDRPLKTLYLLHAGFGGPNDFLYYTGIKKYAEARDLAVVMPSGDNLFFSDQEQFHANLGAFAGDELVRLTRRMFPLSENREDTFIAGCSMGGYAALKLGLKYGSNFGYAAGISAPTLTEAIKEGSDRRTPEMLGGRRFLEAVFGNLDDFAESEHDLGWFAEHQKKSGALLPKLYLSAGQSELLAGECASLGEKLKKEGYDVTCRISPGDHEWTFWDSELKHIIADWLPSDPDRFANAPGMADEQ